MRKVCNKWITSLPNVYEADLANISHLWHFSGPGLNSATHTSFCCHAWVALAHLKDHTCPAWYTYPAKGNEWPTFHTSHLLTTNSQSTLITMSVLPLSPASTRLLQVYERSSFSESQTEAVSLTFILQIMPPKYKLHRPHLSHPSMSWSKTRPSYQQPLPLHIYKHLREPQAGLTY